MARLAWLVPVAVGLLAVAACGSEVTTNGDPDDSDGVDPIEPWDDCGFAGCDCNAGAPICPGGTFEVSYCDEANPDCQIVKVCDAILYCETEAPCGDAYQLCDPGDEEVSQCPAGVDCYTLNCGSTTCAPMPCTVFSPCDPGDVEVDSCPQGVACYDGYTCEPGFVPPLCADVALPQAGCPYDAPTSYEDCNNIGQVCDYDTAPGCFESYGCVSAPGGTPYWEFYGGGCDGSDGSAP